MSSFLYVEAGVKEDWIILGPERQVEVYRQPINGKYQQVRLLAFNEYIECASVHPVQFRVSGLFD